MRGSLFPQVLPGKGVRLGIFSGRSQIKVPRLLVQMPVEHVKDCCDEGPQEMEIVMHIAMDKSWRLWVWESNEKTLPCRRRGLEFGGRMGMIKIKKEGALGKSEGDRQENL